MMGTHISRHEGDESVGDLLRPRERHELVPPSGDHLRHVEAGEERDGDEVAELSAVEADYLKVLSEGVMLKQDEPIGLRLIIAIEGVWHQSLTCTGNSEQSKL